TWKDSVAEIRRGLLSGKSPGGANGMSSPVQLQPAKEVGLMKTQLHRGLQEYLPDAVTCTLCMRVLHDPVTLNCGHNYCHACIQKHWGGAQSNVACPQCPHPRELFRRANGERKPGGRALARLLSGEEPDGLGLDSDLAPLVVEGGQLSDTRVPPPPPLEANVTMDRLTAHPHLLLSASKKIVTHDATPSGLLPGRLAFDTTPCILAEKGFVEGRHCWQVEVTSSGRGWAFGVMKGSVCRKGPVSISTDEGIWALLPEHLPPAEPKSGTCRFRLYLDYEGGTVHFFDGATREPLALLSYAVFLGERIFPFFKLEEPNSQMRIVP
uniref:Uncharacterized protein n=1 Tax=Naja naja TaxID=35670 RepID=A0A8C6YLC8_NAJNA